MGMAFATRIKKALRQMGEGFSEFMVKQFINFYFYGIYCYY
jgi:hypothetical protein